MEMYHLTEMEGQLEMDLFHNRLNREEQAGQEIGKEMYKETVCFLFIYVGVYTRKNIVHLLFLAIVYSSKQ